MLGATRDEKRALACRCPTGAIEILQPLHRQAGSNFVFPGNREGKPLSNMALSMMLRRMNRHDLTAHGFGSTFRDWAAETTGYANEVVEKALAHVVPSATEAAYRGGDTLGRRRSLMDEWATYCAAPAREER